MDFPGELSPSFTFSCTLQKPALVPKRSGAIEMKISEGLQQPWLELKVVGTPLLALPCKSWINSELSIACPSWRSANVLQCAGGHAIYL